jgi:hypothetical protein
MLDLCHLKEERSVQVASPLHLLFDFVDSTEGLEFHPQTGLLLAISGLSSKHLEMFRLRSVAEVKKKLKRRAKRQREKNDPGSGEVAALPEGGGGDEKPTLEDYFESVSNLKSPHKIKSLAFG